MHWLVELASTQPVAWAVLVLSLVATGGLMISTVKLRGVGLGVAGVLFSGIIVGHLLSKQPELHLRPDMLDFVRDFGLILFMFTVGLQLGPGFFASLRRQGLKLNLLAVGVVGLGLSLMLVLAWLRGVDWLSAIGLFSGATTNTPSLGAAQQALKSLRGPGADIVTTALAYAVAYPGGIFSIILTLVTLKHLLRVDPEREAEQFRADQKRSFAALDRMNLVVENPNLQNLPIGEVPGRRETGVVVSRIKRAGATEVKTATEQTILEKGDVILAVGTRPNLEKFRLVIGREAEVNLIKAPGRVVSRKIVVTHREVLGKTIEELDLDALYGVTVTRVARADIEMTAVPELELQFGDMLQVVGDEQSMAKAIEVLGNSVKALNETNFIPIFIGIALGILLGLVPIRFPGIPEAVRFGITGGPLVLAIILSRIGRVGSLVWYMPANANLAFRELGSVLFLSCVGLKAGDRFFEMALTANGWTWLWIGFCISIIPIFVIGLTARLVFKLNFTTISGLLAGSMTDTPALAFATGFCKSDAPSIAYATVYPLTLLLRVVAVQVLVLFLCR
jgi:putative transport protein